MAAVATVCTSLVSAHQLCHKRENLLCKWSVIINILEPQRWTEGEEAKTGIHSGKKNFLEEGWGKRPKEGTT